MQRARLLVSLSLLAACGGPGTDASSRTEAPAAAAPASASAPRDPRGPAGPLPFVRGTPTPNGEVALAIEQRAPGTSRLAPAVRVERLEGDAFAPVDVTGLALRPSCDAEAPRCTELALGGALHPPAWTGRTGRGQCTPASDGRAAAPGTYRFVVETCEGVDVASAPFTLAR